MYAEFRKGAHAGAPLQVNIAHPFQMLTGDAHHVGFGGVWGSAPRGEIKSKESAQRNLRVAHSARTMSSWMGAITAVSTAHLVCA
jgi:hypothetical protein